MFSLAEFCAYAGISRSFYYVLQHRGCGPKEIRLGTRVLIAKDTADAWLKSREQVA